MREGEKHAKDLSVVAKRRYRGSPSDIG